MAKFVAQISSVGAKSSPRLEKSVAVTSDDLRKALEQQSTDFAIQLSEMKDNLCDSMQDMLNKLVTDRSGRQGHLVVIPSGSFSNPVSTPYPFQLSTPVGSGAVSPPRRLSLNTDFQSIGGAFQPRVWRRPKTRGMSTDSSNFGEQIMSSEEARSITAAPGHYYNLSDDDEVPTERCGKHNSPRDGNERSSMAMRDAKESLAMSAISTGNKTSGRSRSQRLSSTVSFRKTTVAYNHHQSDTTTVKGFAESFYYSIVELVVKESLDCISAAMVLLNALWIGYEVDYVLPYQNTNKALPPFVLMVDFAFCVFFVVELLFRVVGYGRQFFTGENRHWHLLDSILVLAQILDVAFQYCGEDVNSYVEAWLRLVRLVRVVRMIRLIRFVSDLRMIVMSIMGCVKCLMWTMFLLLMIMYAVAICLREIFEDITAVAAASKSRMDLPVYCSSLGRIILALFASITGGINWGDLVYPFYRGGFPVMGAILCFYIAFCIFALMNVVTGVFVERAVITAERDNNTVLVDNLCDLFNLTEDASETTTITWDVFESRLDTEEMRDYFEAVNLDISEAPYLFEILDMDGNGSVDREEFISGLLRLRGNAKALDLTMLIRETSRVYQHMHQQMQRMECHITRMTSQSDEGTFTGNQVQTNPSRSAVSLCSNMSASMIEPSQATSRHFRSNVGGLDTFPERNSSSSL